jgi:hypothetical protein
MATRDIRNHAHPAVDHQHDPIDTVPSVRQHAQQASPPQQPAAPAIQLPHNWRMQRVDDAQRKILLEQAWSGVEFKKREPRNSELTKPAHGTGAFTMWGPPLAGVPKLTVPARLPYSTYSDARFDSWLAKEERLCDEAEVKHQQLIRHGLVSRESLVPILAVPEMPEKEEKRRRKAAAAQIDKYKYESSGDEEEPTGRLARLKTALKVHELPPPPPKQPLPPPPEDAESDTEGTGNSLKRKADETSSASDDEEERETKRSKVDGGDSSSSQQLHMLPPALNFQEATRNPGHPDFGLSFSSALELALAKEMDLTRENWTVEGDAAEDAEDAEEAAEDAAEAAEDAAAKPIDNDAVAAIEKAASTASSSASKAKQQKASQKSSSSSEQRPKLMLNLSKKSATSTTSASSLPTTPQQPARAPLLPRAGRPIRITRLHVQPLYDQDSFEAAVAMREMGLDFGDLRMVGWYNRQMQGENRSRPIRNQKSLMRVSRMTWEEHNA